MIARWPVLRLVGSLALSAGVAGCAIGGYDDAGTGVVLDARIADAGSAAHDAGPRTDGSAPRDAGRRDAGLGATDAGIRDAGRTDAGRADSGRADAGPGASTACIAALTPTHFDFESTPTGWTSLTMDGYAGDTSWPFNPWAFGAPLASQVTAFAGSCLGTGHEENYAQCGRAETRSATFNLSACASDDVYLVLEHHYDFWSGSYNGSMWYDGGLIEVSADGGSTWLALDPTIYPGTIRINPNRGSSFACYTGGFYVHNRPGFVGQSGAWQHLEVRLPAAAHGATSVRVRFAFASGVSSATINPDVSRDATAPGWFIDDFHLEAR